METKINYTAVGAFVIILIAFIILAVIWLTSGFPEESYKMYIVYMEESVSGLSEEGPVEYNGVHVGEIKNIQIDPHNPRSVELLLKVKGSTPITRGTRARIDVRSLGGTAMLLLVDKGTDLAPLEVVGDQPYPVIQTTPSFFLRLDTALTELNNNFRSLTESFRTLLDKQNLRSIKESLINIREVTGVLADDSEQLRDILEHTSKVTETLQTQTMPSANQAITNFSAVTQNLSDVSQEIKENPAIFIRGKAPLPNGPGE